MLHTGAAEAAQDVFGVGGAQFQRSRILDHLELVQKWLKEHNGVIANLEESSRSAYVEVRNLAANPELVPISYPAKIQGRSADGNWEKHLYTDSGDRYTAEFNVPETALLTQELGRKDVIAWLRNVDRKPWALCVPYEVDGEYRAMYPDFLFVRKEKQRLVVDIIEPHSISLADAPAKAAGMARFAALHADRFGRIELILLQGNNEKKLDLTDETVRNKVRGVKLVDQLKQLMD